MNGQPVAGRALDVEIARRFFNVKRLYGHDGTPWDGESEYPQYIPSGKPWRTHSIDASMLPWFSRDLASAWLVVEGLAEQGYSWWFAYGHNGDTLHAQAWVTRPWMSGPELVVDAETMPLAICLAALQAISVEADR